MTGSQRLQERGGEHDQVLYQQKTKKKKKKAIKKDEKKKKKKGEETDSSTGCQGKPPQKQKNQTHTKTID